MPIPPDTFIYIFDINYSIVHERPYRYGDTSESHSVYCQSHNPENTKCYDDRDRQRKGGDNGFEQIKDEDKEDDDNEK